MRALWSAHLHVLLSSIEVFDASILIRDKSVWRVTLFVNVLSFVH